ncbi:MAG: SDR family oxidoreductase [Dehalococcoidia bacterium]
MTVVAIAGPANDLHRELAVAAAEAGCDVALASLHGEPDQEFAVNSIANEVWVVGAENFARALDASDPTAVASFADEVSDRLGSCEIALFISPPTPAVEADEFSADELLPLLDPHVNAPFLVAQAFGRVMQRQGNGTVLLVVPEDDGLPAAIFEGALQGLAANTDGAWRSRGVQVHCVRPQEAAERLAAAVAERKAAR